MSRQITHTSKPNILPLFLSFVLFVAVCVCVSHFQCRVQCELFSLSARHLGFLRIVFLFC